MITPEIFGFLGAGLIILIGFIAHLIFARTKIPDFLWLIALGLIVGPVTGLIDPAIFASITPYFVALALIMILYDGGLNMDIYKLIREAPRGFALSVIGFSLTAGLIALLAMKLLGFTLINSLILGVILGGPSSAIVIPFVKGIRTVSDKAAMILEVESAMTDAFCIVFFIAITTSLSLSVPLNETANFIAASFSIAVVIGIAAGMFWLFVLNRIMKMGYSYMTTLGFLFIIYFMAEYLNASGPISCLFFGVMMGNAGKISEMFRTKEKYRIDPTMKNFHSQLSFIVRSFFFVYLGMIVTLGHTEFILFGIIATLCIFAVRPIAVFVSTIREKITLSDRKIMSLMAPRGLAAAVLATMPAKMGIAGSDFFVDITFSVILSGAILTSVGIYMAQKSAENEKLNRELGTPIMKGPYSTENKAG